MVFAAKWPVIPVGALEPRALAFAPVECRDPIPLDHSLGDPREQIAGTPEAV